MKLLECKCGYVADEKEMLNHVKEMAKSEGMANHYKATIIK